MNNAEADSPLADYMQDPYNGGEDLNAGHQTVAGDLFFQNERGDHRCGGHAGR